MIDISYPKNPIIVGSCDTPDYTEDVLIAGNYVYLAGTDLQVIEKFSELTDIFYKDSNTLTATVNPGYRIGGYDLHITNPDGGRAVLKNAFTVYHSGISSDLRTGGNGNCFINSIIP